MGGGRIAADEDGKSAGLYYRRKMLIEQCEVLWAKIEVHAARLTGRQVDFTKAAQLADRASDAGDVVAQVQLDDFITGALAGIGDVHVHRQGLGGR